jgi:hypothetical protein
VEVDAAEAKGSEAVAVEGLLRKKEGRGEKF